MSDFHLVNSGIMSALGFYFWYALINVYLAFIESSEEVGEWHSRPRSEGGVTFLIKYEILHVRDKKIGCERRTAYMSV